MNPRETLPGGQKHNGRPTTDEQLVDLNASIAKALEAPAKKRKLLLDARAVRVAPGVFGQRNTNEKMQKDMDALFLAEATTNVQEKIQPATLIETKLEQKNMEPKITMDTPPVEKEKTATQKYNEGYDRRVWSKDKSKTAEPADKQPNINNWQDEAIKEFEKSGKKVLDAELVPPSGSIDTVVTPTPTHRTEGLHTLDINQAVKDIEQNELNLKVKKGLNVASSDVEAREEKAKVPFGFVGKLAEAYNAYPKSLKWAIVATLTASGLGAAAMGAVALGATAGAIGMGMRVGAGAATFIGLERWLKAREEKDTGRPREKSVEALHAAQAGILAIFVGAALPTVLREGLETTGISDAIFDKITEKNVDVATTQAVTTEAPIENGEYIKTVEAGDSVWKIAAGVVAEKFPELSAEQQTYVTDAIKDRVVAYPESFGIEGSDASNLATGERIDFGGILNDEEFMNKTLVSAQNLNPSEIGNIQNYDNRLAPETEPSTEAPATEPTGFTKEELKTWKPVIPVDEVSSPSTNLTTEGPSVGQEAGNPNALVEAGTLKGAFQYGPNGAVTGFSVNETLEYPQTLETQKLLNPSWRAGLSTLDSRAVQMNANTVYSYEQLLHTLEQKGAGSSPEATFLREEMDRLITGTEKVSGDVFNGNVAYPPEPSSHINLPTNPEVMAQINVEATKATDSWIKEVFGKAGWFGFGADDGKEIFANFANESVDSILDRKDSIPSVDMDKVIKMIEDAKKETGMPWRSGEAVEDYLHRAAVVDIENYKKTK